MRQLLLLLLTLTLFSCSNNDEIGENIEKEGTTKLLKEIYRNKNNWFKFEYDNNQRLTKVIERRDDTGTKDTLITEFKYNDDNTIRVNGYNSSSSTIVSSRVYILDDEGYLIKVNYKNHLGKYTVEYSYVNGYVSKEICYGDRSWNATYLWENSNVVGVTKKYYNNDRTYMDKFTYDYNNVNRLNINVLPYVYRYESQSSLPMISFKGMITHDCVIKHHNTWNRINNYVYTFDSAGYPTKCKVIETDDNRTYTYKYTYY